MNDYGSLEGNNQRKRHDVLLTPEYYFPEGGMFSGIADERQREYETRKFLIEYWGLEGPNVEWYVLKKTVVEE